MIIKRKKSYGFAKINTFVLLLVILFMFLKRIKRESRVNRELYPQL